eukprot:CAMPEP_0198296198 /NCGR_PEP_ID=MMETSP1449-20131203/31410_1 /TAXON_ID=420275 /ORGANISM="Attheya septentrionalis, Strain CCMP2084" /LENGTH=773 /DNA_ID=CAMNT_0043996739 /DNA_START=154 /DNA_END=2472 /DNA_ORIENTATION=+
MMGDAIDFFKEGTKRGDGWVEFCVTHRGGLHVLQMCYASLYSSPCMLRIGPKSNDSRFESVAYDTTPASSSGKMTPQWFMDEGTFDLGGHTSRLSYDITTRQTTVAFKPHEQFPNIVSFRFVPVEVGDASTSWRKSVSRHMTKRMEIHRRYLKANAQNICRWRHSPTAVTFTFEIGCEHDEGAKMHTMEPFLQGKPVQFVYGECHQSVAVEGSVIGRYYNTSMKSNGISNMSKVCFVRDDDFISSLTMGLSTSEGRGAFTGLKFVRQKENTEAAYMPRRRRAKSRQWDCVAQQKKEGQRVQVGCHLQAPTWTYDRDKLGLNLWITAIHAPEDKHISRYQFTLSSDTNICFNPDEFSHFWQWFVVCKHNMVLECNQRQEKGKPKKDWNESDLIALENRTEYLRSFLLASFSGVSVNPGSTEGYLYATKRFCHITFDVFSIYIYWLPEKGCHGAKSIVFVDGKQFDTTRSRLAELKISRNEILGFAIHMALQDLDLLYQMGLTRIMPEDDMQHIGDEIEAEFLPLLSDPPNFSGDYNNTPRARYAVSILATAGLRKVAYQTIMADPDGWDLYNLAAGSYPMIDRATMLLFWFVAVIVAILQLASPIFLIIRGAQIQQQNNSQEELLYDTYIVRFLYAIYALFFEFKTWDVDDEERVIAWLSFLPEFSTRKLVLGMVVNKLSKLFVNAAIIIVLLSTTSVLDATLNALALYFICEVDNNLVSESILEKLRHFQREEYFNIKSKTAMEFASPDSKEESDIPHLKDLSAQYFVFASRW